MCIYMFVYVLESKSVNVVSITVFPPIEALGAKERVRGASIFCPNAPNFDINIVKKDS